jgi:hypothetical protein
LRSYAVIFGILKQSKQKENFFRPKKLKFTRFLHRRRIFQEIQGFFAFLCGNILHFEAKQATKLRNESLTHSDF